MKILIISDNHGKCENLEKVLQREKPLNALVHCGDLEGTEDYIQVLAECPTYMVSGNNDFFSDLPRELDENVEGYQFMVSHGHYYGVSMGLNGIREEGLSRGADIVAFGHTHKPVIKKYENIILINPGSLAYPRQEGRRPTYVVMETDPQGNLQFSIKEL